MANYRNRKLLDVPHNVEVCQFLLPGVCRRHQGHGCEPAHSNNISDGKGTGIKSHDHMHVAACHSCHMEYDSGAKFTKDEKRLYFSRAWYRTMRYYLDKGLLVPNPKHVDYLACVEFIKDGPTWASDDWKRAVMAYIEHGMLVPYAK